MDPPTRFRSLRPAAGRCAARGRMAILQPLSNVIHDPKLTEVNRGRVGLPRLSKHKGSIPIDQAVHPRGALRPGPWKGQQEWSRSCR